MKYKSTFLPILAILLLTGWSVTLYTQALSGRAAGEASIKQVFDTILDRYVAEIDPEKLADAAIVGSVENGLAKVAFGKIELGRHEIHA